MKKPTIRILIVSFYFPPYDKVGGRRWAKHCKYFKKTQTDFKVIAGDFDGNSAWDKDVESFKDSIIRVPLVRKNRPYHVRKLPTNFIEKIYWKVSYCIWERRKKKLIGNYLDVSLGNENNFYLQTKSLLSKEKFDLVLISAGPFTYTKMIPKLWAEYPNIKFLIDYRDYWEDAFTDLTNDQVEYEKEMQNKVIAAVDLILTPNAEMSDYFAHKFKKRVYTLPHCFDMDDVIVSSKISQPNERIKIIYGGAFYRNIEKQIDLVKKLVDILNKVKPTVCDFYISVKGFEKELQHPLIKRHNFLAAQDYFKEVASSNYVILILANDRVNAMSSKFYELVALRKAILYFGGEGEVSDFIIKNKLGFHVTVENLDAQTSKIISNLQSKEIPDISYDIGKHTFEHQTKLFLEELRSLK